MDCPREISAILIEMLRMGLLHIRALAWSGGADFCAVEADHPHNLPNLIADYSHEKLLYYWEIERPSYLKRASEPQRVYWEHVWKSLRPHVEGLNVPIEMR